MTILPVVLLLAGGAQPPAFPGAEGFGAVTAGGRGGRVIAVTTLADSGPGSFRAACQAEGPRIIVFRVGGIIDLEKSIEISNPFVTIAGQTAPGDGICLRGDSLNVRTHDVVLRFLRSRPGDISGREVDAMNLSHGSSRVIVDHCSASWSVDEALSLSGHVSDVTVQWSIVAEGLNHSVHHKGAHGYGSLARADGGVTFHHNLWAHNAARNPRLGDNYGKPPFPTFDVRNNVMYDYGGTATGLTQGVLKVNFAGNCFRTGPSSRARSAITVGTPSEMQFYVDGNEVDGEAVAGAALFTRMEAEGKRQVTLAARPFDVPPVKTEAAAAALERVLEGAGCAVPARDAVDRRIVAEVRARSGSIIDSQKQRGGWPEYRGGTPPADSDLDGMPDAWERAHGLNPRDPSDAAKDRDGDGYTNIEEYLNELVKPARGPAADEGVRPTPLSIRRSSAAACRTPGRRRTV